MGLRRIIPARSRGGRKAGLWALGFVLIAAPASAQVIEVRPDAEAVTYAGPVVWSDEGVRALQPPAAPMSAGSVGEVIRAAAARHSVSPALVEAVAWQESRLKQRAVSPKGARGVMQLMPGTARELGVDADDLVGNVEGGVAYLARLMNEFDGDLVKTLAAYNAGPGAVKRHGGVPPYAETQGYVAAVLARLAASTGTP